MVAGDLPPFSSLSESMQAYGYRQNPSDEALAREIIINNHISRCRECRYFFFLSAAAHIPLSCLIGFQARRIVASR